MHEAEGKGFGVQRKGSLCALERKGERERWWWCGVVEGGLVKGVKEQCAVSLCVKRCTLCCTHQVQQRVEGCGQCVAAAAVAAVAYHCRVECVGVRG